MTNDELPNYKLQIWNNNVNDKINVNEWLLGLVVDCGPLHLGDNLSRHLPIMVKLDLGVLAKRKKMKAVKFKWSAWYKATEQQQADYRIDLEERLKRVALLASLDCRDTHCRDEI